MCGAADTITPPLANVRLVGEVQVIGEDRELVRLAVAVGVLDDLDPVVAGLAVAHVVRVVDRLDDPQPPALVERERDRLDDVRLGGEELEREAGRDLDELHRLLRRERQLKLRSRIAVLVVRDVVAVLVLQLRHLQLVPALPRLVWNRVEEALLDQLSETGDRPGFLAAVGRVEHSTFPLRADPRLRRADAFLDTLHQHGASRRALLRERVGIVGRRERLKPLEDRAGRLELLRRELRRSFALASRADQVPRTPTRTETSRWRR